MAVNFIYKRRGRSLVSDKPGKHIFTAGFPAVYPIKDVCNVDQYIKSSGSLSLSVKDNCSQKLPTDYFRFSWTAMGTLSSYTKYQPDPNTTHRPKNFLVSMMKTWLGDFDAGTIPAGFSARGSSFILPFSGGTQTEVILQGDVTEVKDICNPATSVGQIVRVSGTQFGYTEDCEKFVRSSVSGKMFINTTIYPTMGDGYDDINPNNVNVHGMMLLTVEGSLTQASADAEYLGVVNKQATYAP